MELLLYYGIFAATTATACVLQLIYPVLKELQVTHPWINVVGYFKLTIVTFWFFTLLIAPMMIFPYFFSSMGERFKAALKISLTKEN